MVETVLREWIHPFRFGDRSARLRGDYEAARTLFARATDLLPEGTPACVELDLERSRVLFEAGHVAQAICLVAAEHDLGSLCVGGFRDARLNQFLNFDGTTQAVVYCVGVGHPAEPPSP